MSAGFPFEYRKPLTCALETSRKKVVKKKNVKLFASKRRDHLTFLLCSSDQYLISLQSEVKLLSVLSVSLV